MKQHFTEDQWNELSEAEKQRFIEWTISKGEHASSRSARSIGHLIWFLDDHEATTNEWYHGGFLCKRDLVPGHFEWHVYRKDDWHESSELVDALWLAVKAVLKEGGESEDHKG